MLHGAVKPSLNPDALNKLLGQMVNDLGAAVNGALVVLGDGLGIYTALADCGPTTSQKLAERTNLNERHLREWLSAQAASGYVSYDAASETFFLTAEQTAVFADPNSPAAMTGGFYGISSVYHDEPLIAESFRTGAGLPWGKHHTCLFCGTERFFRPGYQANINENWIPALDGVQQKLMAYPLSSWRRSSLNLYSMDLICTRLLSRQRFATLRNSKSRTSISVSLRRKSFQVATMD